MYKCCGFSLLTSLLHVLYPTNTNRGRRRRTAAERKITAEERSVKMMNVF